LNSVCIHFTYVIAYIDLHTSKFCDLCTETTGNLVGEDKVDGNLVLDDEVIAGDEVNVDFDETHTGDEGDDKVSSDHMIFSIGISPTNGN